MLMDEWRLREQTSGQFGMLSAEHSIWAEDATGARILIVEDNAVEIFKLEETLAPLAREVVHAPTIAEAYEQALQVRSEEHTSELVTNAHLVCRLMLEKKKKKDS